MGEERTRAFSDRVFLNALVILKSAVIAYGALALVKLLEAGTPLDSADLAALYTAWLGTMLLVTLTFVSQAMGSTNTPITPNVFVMVTTFALGVSEFVLFAVLEPPHPAGAREPIRDWLLALAASAAIAWLFVSVVLGQIGSKLHPYTRASADERDRIRFDRRLVGLNVLLLAGAAGALHRSPHLPGLALWGITVAVASLFTAGLLMQPRKMELLDPPPGGRDVHDDSGRTGAAADEE